MATDPEGESPTWTIEGTDAADFNISATGELTFAATPDFEAPRRRQPPQRLQHPPQGVGRLGGLHVRRDGHRHQRRRAGRDHLLERAAAGDHRLPRDPRRPRRRRQGRHLAVEHRRHGHRERDAIELRAARRGHRPDPHRDRELHGPGGRGQDGDGGLGELGHRGPPRSPSRPSSPTRRRAGARSARTSPPPRPPTSPSPSALPSRPRTRTRATP